MTEKDTPVPSEKDRFLDETTISMDAPSFQKLLAWMASPPSDEEREGINRLLAAK